MRNGVLGLSARNTTVQVRGRVLVVDDDKLLAATLRKRLEAAGYEVDVANDGETASRMAAHECPDIAILDVMLPNIDGFDLCRRLKRLPVRRPPKVILLSAIAAGTGKSDEELRVRSGADSFLSKPCRFSELLEEITKD
jgi:DNA-binding response OmpR family regulator